MRRLMLLIAAGSLWLFLAAVPVFADGGPHVASVNNGTRRRQRRQLRRLPPRPHGPGRVPARRQLRNRIVPDLSRLDRPRSDDRRRERRAVRARDHGVRGGQVLGYLRGGGFVNARIGSGEAVRLAYLSGGDRPPERQGAGQDRRVPGRHLGPPAERRRRGRWRQSSCLGQRPRQHDVRTPARSSTSSARPATTRTATAQYRILNPIPNPTEATRGRFVPAAAAANVTDAALPGAGDTRNYTIIQTNGGTGTLLASQVAALSLPATAGDYWRRKVPWNGTTGTSNDAPNGQSATFDSQTRRGA